MSNSKQKAVRSNLQNLSDTMNKMVVKFVAEKDKPFNELMNEEIGSLAKIVDIDRVSIWRNSYKDDVQYTSQICRWDKASGGITKTLDGLSDVVRTNYFPGWEKILSENEVINSPVRLLPEQDAAILRNFGVVSVFIAPIFINDLFWGTVLFTDHRNERHFEDVHASFMRSAAFLFASAVIRDELEKEVAEANEFKRILLDNAPIGINVFDENFIFIDNNDTILNMLGTSGSDYHDFLRELSPEYQPDGTPSIDKAFEILKRTMNDEKQKFEWIYESVTGELIPCEITTMLAKHKGKNIGISYIYDLRQVKNMERKILELELEVVESKISIMLSQIQPHFLFNSLTAIRELCYIDPETAIEALDEFSSYLRSNLDSLAIKKPIPFEHELRHVKTYLSLEKRRFGDKLKIIYDIRASNFLIPALTIQPIVENAVRHGVTKREEGGTVTIKVEESETEATITVTDDGIGFDSNTTKKGERISIGVKNVRSRLASMCGGTITIKSEPGTGTTAVIVIPKDRGQV